MARCTLPTLAVVQAVGSGRRGEDSAHFEVDRRAIFQAVAVGDWRARQGVAGDVAKAVKVQRKGRPSEGVRTLSMS